MAHRFPKIFNQFSMIRLSSPIRPRSPRKKSLNATATLAALRLTTQQSSLRLPTPLLKSSLNRHKRRTPIILLQDLLLLLSRTSIRILTRHLPGRKRAASDMFRASLKVHPLIQVQAAKARRLKTSKWIGVIQRALTIVEAGVVRVRSATVL